MTNIRTLIAENVNGSTFIGMDTETDVKLTGGKKNPLQGQVTKRTIGNSVMIFQNKNSNGYKNMIERRLEKEGKDPSSFTLGQRTWGTRLANTPFVEHKGQYYLEVIFLKGGTSTYLVDGVEIKKEDITGLPTTPPPSQQGGLDNKVIIRTFKVESITQMKIAKQSYTNLAYTP